MNISYADKAQVLNEALPYIKKYSDKIVVIKYGGNAMINEELKNYVMQDIVLLRQIGIKVVLVHGGGPEISETLKKMNIPSKFVGGLRQTDAETVNVVQMVLAGTVNKDLVNLIENSGGKAIGLSGIDGHMIEAQKLSDELGFVGEITNINVRPILDTLDAGYIPVISTVGCDKENNVYNINADTAASKIAGALGAYSMISMTDIKGLMRDLDDDSSLISALSVSDVPALVEGGVISGGMIPKIQCCVDAITHGVTQVVIIDGRVPHSILIEMLTDAGIGTLFY